MPDAPLTDDAFLTLLRCPSCGGSLAFEAAAAPAVGRAAFGVLRCGCAAYPVVDGVPVLRRGTVAVRSIADRRVVGDGPTAEHLVALVESGRGEEALVRLLAFPPCPWPLNLTPAGRALGRAPVAGPAALAVRRRTLARWLRRRDALTAEDWFALFYWRSPTVYDPFSYFFFRFAQPRHLATLALAPALASPRPVLDLACGYGHLLHSLTGGGATRPAVGADQNFHQAWVGRHWVAPGAQYVCADASARLPFADGAFGAAVCADAFHYLGHAETVAAEMQRAAQGGTVVIARTGNLAVEPHEGEEHTAEGYRAMLAPWTVRTLGEDGLVGAYLAGRSPDLAAESEPAADAAKWLYLVAAEDAAALPAPQPLGVTHTAGRPALNPLYAGDGAPLRFPSPWYAFENAAMAGYHAPEARLAAADRAALDAGTWTPGLADAATRFVTLGLPARYARPRRPWSMTANRALTGAVARLRALRG